MKGSEISFWASTNAFVSLQSGSSSHLYGSAIWRGENGFEVEVFASFKMPGCSADPISLLSILNQNKKGKLNAFIGFKAS